MPSAPAQTNPVKIASEARFDLVSTTVKLTNGAVLTGSGQIQRPNWSGVAEQARAYTASFAVTPFAWNEFAVRFVPLADGVVELKLMGPWEEAATGVPYFQEILWDALEATGTTLTNGGFERMFAAGRNVQGWQGGRSIVLRATPELPAAEGRNYAYAWHNRPVTTALRVTAGTPVTLRVHARASLPPGYEDMRRLTSHDSPAHVAARRFQRGANLGNYLEAPRSQNWGAKYSEADFKAIRAEGFDHVRLPIAWHQYAGPGPDFKLSDEIFSKADFLVTNALNHGLNVLMNIHHFDAFTSDPAAHTNDFYALWRQIARHYAGTPLGVAFELINEPKDKATTVVLNPIYAAAIRHIRDVSPRRTIFVGPGKWNSITELAALKLPDNDDNLIVTVHCYDPFYFTHQGASWTKPATDTKGIIFPGPPPTPLVPAPSVTNNQGVVNWINEYNTQPTAENPSSPRAFRGKLRTAREWSDYYGRPVHVGEFGCYIGADAASRARFYAEFRRALGEARLGWAMWDWKAGFRYWDDTKHQPAAGMREALFPKP